MTPAVFFKSSLIICLGLSFASSPLKAIAEKPQVDILHIDPRKGFADLVSPLLPAVVNIATTTQIKTKSDMGQLPGDLPFKGSPLEDFFKDFMDKMQPEGPRNVTSLGSGFIIDPEGYIVTNNHVVAEADQITVILNDNTELKATLVGRDRRTDIALLKVTANKKLPAVQWGDSKHLRVGEWVIAIGNPFGLGGTVTAGIVSHMSRDIRENGDRSGSGDFIDGYIQTDASINVGNSGGPMFDTQGRVVGVNRVIYSPTGGNVGIGFAIPAETAKKVVDQIRQYGRTKRGWIGVRIQPINEDIAEGLGLKKAEGALIGSVIADGPAAKAKIASGDVIIKIGDAEVKDSKNLPRIVSELPVDSEVTLTLWRKGQMMTAKVRIGEFEEAEETGMIASPDGGKQLTKGIAIHGMTLQALSPEARQRYDIDDDVEGVLVVDVAPKTSAAEKGIRPGDIILKISQEEVKKPQDVIQRIKDAEKEERKSILLLIDRDGEPRYISIKIGPEETKS